MQSIIASIILQALSLLILLSYSTKVTPRQVHGVVYYPIPLMSSKANQTIKASCAFAQALKILSFFLIISTMAKSNQPQGYNMLVPVDASQIENFQEQEVQTLKVVSENHLGITSQIVQLNEEGKGEAVFNYDNFPGQTTYYVGPVTVEDEELPKSQTLRVQVNSRLWNQGVSAVRPVRVSPFYWFWWLLWCRKFTIRGRVVCADGSPVSNAKVCVYDVDCFWWWTSKQKVACATTDLSGSFEIEFTWCCGYWPWWFWRYRNWRLDTGLVEQIQPVLKENFPEINIPAVSAEPDLSVFSSLINSQEESPFMTETLINSNSVEAVRQRVLNRFNFAPIFNWWPFQPWRPWADCRPDIIFEVTQNCDDEEKTIYKESIWQVRRNIPNVMNVTLEASEEACCIPIPPVIPEGNCLLLNGACSYTKELIGGNATAPATPVGYAFPFPTSKYSDRPFAETIPLYGLFGDGTNVDYYEFEISRDGGSTWDALDPTTTGAVTRRYEGDNLTTGIYGTYSVVFPFQTIDGRNVIESKERFEANNDPTGWGLGLTRVWVANETLLMNWRTKIGDDIPYQDGTYQLRVKSWQYDPSTQSLINDTILPACFTEDPNELTLTIDNRQIAAEEPLVDFLNVSIIRKTADGDFRIPVNPCDVIEVDASNKVDEIEFEIAVYDAIGHLREYTFKTEYGASLSDNILTLSGATKAAASFDPSSAIPPADSVGNDYLDAIGDGITRPYWFGGRIKVVAPLHEVFPITCAYNLELLGYKRNVRNCGNQFYNKATFSLTVNVS